MAPTLTSSSKYSFIIYYGGFLYDPILNVYTGGFNGTETNKHSCLDSRIDSNFLRNIYCSLVNFSLRHFIDNF